MEPKYKIGQKVRCKEHNTEFIIKDIVKMLSEDKYLYYDIAKDSSECSIHKACLYKDHSFMRATGVPEEQLELVEDNQSDFKVGDYVRIIRIRTNQKNITNNKIYEIIDSYLDDPVIRCDNNWKIFLGITQYEIIPKEQMTFICDKHDICKKVGCDHSSIHKCFSMCALQCMHVQNQKCIPYIEENKKDELKIGDCITLTKCKIPLIINQEYLVMNFSGQDIQLKDKHGQYIWVYYYLNNIDYIKMIKKPVKLKVKMKVGLRVKIYLDNNNTVNATVMKINSSNKAFCKRDDNWKECHLWMCGFNEKNNQFYSNNCRGNYITTIDDIPIIGIEAEEIKYGPSYVEKVAPGGIIVPKWVSKLFSISSYNSSHRTLEQNIERKLLIQAFQISEDFITKYQNLISKEEKFMFSISKYIDKLAKIKYPGALQVKKRQKYVSVLTENQEFISQALQEKWIEEHAKEIFEIVEALDENDTEK